jgi:AhpD family alkylhydroperoxidase
LSGVDAPSISRVANGSAIAKENYMSQYRVHTIESAPEGSKAPMTGLRKAIGMVPNLAAAMAESPELLRAFLSLREIFYGGTFTGGEIQVLALTNAFENGCVYCMSLHSAFALKEGVSAASVDALRDGRSPSEPKLAALSAFSRKLVRGRGGVTPDDLGAFMAAGYTKAQALEVVLGVAVSILPKYAHHLTKCPVDDAFKDQLWSPPR